MPNIPSCGGYNSHSLESFSSQLTPLVSVLLSDEAPTNSHNSENFLPVFILGVFQVLDNRFTSNLICLAEAQKHDSANVASMRAYAPLVMLKLFSMVSFRKKIVVAFLGVGLQVLLQVGSKVNLC